MAHRTFVLSDLHGHFDIFQRMLQKIAFDEEDILYVLGDCCDRGPESWEIYHYLWQHQNNIKMLKGNHELMMRDALMERANPKSVNMRQWAMNGGKKTVEEYDAHIQALYPDEDSTSYQEAFKDKMIDYINSCPSYYEITINNQDYVLIHAGINPEKTLEDQNEEECAWMREYFFMSKGLDDKLIIFGHTPCSYLNGQGNFNVWRDPIFNDKIGIDGGLGPFDEGQLNCLCLEDMNVYVIKKNEIGD